MNEQNDASAAVIERLRALEVGDGVSHGAMTLFPLFAKREAVGGESIEYRLLAEAVADGHVVVSERPSATVPELLLTNSGPVPVLVLGGEEIVGGKQNRIVNASFLVGAASTVALPVSCVEQGRWHPVSDRFTPGEISYFNLKRAAHAQVGESLRARRHASADQIAIWNELSERQARAGGYSDTGAMSDLFRNSGDGLAAYERAFPWVPGATGVVAALGDHVVAAEAFARERTAEALWPRLVRSYALDALEEPDCAPVSRSRAIRFIARSHAARCEVYPSLGLGQDVRFDGDGVFGSALVYRDQPLYTALFRSDRGGPTRANHLARGSVRRDLLQ